MVKKMILAALLVAATTANAHVCIHGDPQIQSAFAAASVAHTTYYHTFEAQAVAGREAIRVGIDYSNLVPSKYCTTDTDMRPYITSGSIINQQCTQNSVFNPSTMRTIIVDQLMPKAKAIIESTYNVTRIASQTITSGQCGAAVDVSGVSNPLVGVDLQIFVAAGVFPAGSENTIAYAYPCTLEGGSSGRPISAVINFNSNYLYWDDAATYSNEELVQTALHELHHAMGFTGTNLNNFAQSRSIRGKNVSEIRTPNVLAKAKEFYGCDDITGVEIEDEGGSGSKGSHWERRTVYEELMVAAGGAKLSVFTLAFMEDLGYYNVNYSKATSMVVGKGAGCGFVDNKCNTEAGGKDSAWFFDTNYRCSPDHKIMTVSNWRDTGSAALPFYFQYDPDRPSFGAPESGFTDRCPYGQRVAKYECAWEVLDNSDAASIGSYPGIGSRCFETSGLRVDSSSSSVSFNSRCIQARCPFGGTRIEFKLGNTWASCPIDGSVGSANSPAGYSGTIYCPSPASFCDEEISTGSSVREEKASGDASLAESTAFSSITITASFNGTQWESLLSDTSRVALINHLRQDTAYFLKTSSSNLRARRVTATSTGLSAIFGIAEQSYTDDTVRAALNNVLNDGSFLVYTRQTYGATNAAAAAEAPYVGLVGFTVDQPQSESICSKSMSPEKCVTIIAVVVFAVVCVILLILIYCICLRNPFSQKPHPMGTLKYGSGANGKDKM